MDVTPAKTAGSFTPATNPAPAPPPQPPETLEQFLRSDPTFQPTNTGNAFKVALDLTRIEDKNEQIHDNVPVVGFWYRDLTGFFGNAQHIDVVYMPHSHQGHQAPQHVTLDLLRPGFYQGIPGLTQMMDPKDIPLKPEQAWVAFDLNGLKWDSRDTHNYEVHFQKFPTHPW